MAVIPEAEEANSSKLSDINAILYQMSGQKSAFPKLNNFLVKRGISDKQVKELINYSKKDSLVKKFTSDTKRFKDLSSYEAWRTNGKSIYTLTNREGDLLGIIWFSKKSSGFLHYPFTFGIRTYGGARGKGLARNFMQSSFEAFTRSKTYTSSREKGVWLEVTPENVHAIKLYADFGFKEAGNSQKGKIIMLFTPRY